MVTEPLEHSSIFSLKWLKSFSEHLHWADKQLLRDRIARTLILGPIDWELRSQMIEWQFKNSRGFLISKALMLSATFDSAANLLLWFKIIRTWFFGFLDLALRALFPFGCCRQWACNSRAHIPASHWCTGLRFLSSWFSFLLYLVLS